MSGIEDQSCDVKVFMLSTSEQINGSLLPDGGEGVGHVPTLISRTNSGCPRKTISTTSWTSLGQEAGQSMVKMLSFICLILGMHQFCFD